MSFICLLFVLIRNYKQNVLTSKKKKKEKRLLFDSGERFELCVSRPKFRFQPDVILSNSACSELFSRCACETRFCFFPFSFDVNPFFPPHVASRVAWSSQTLNFLFWSFPYFQTDILLAINSPLEIYVRQARLQFTVLILPCHTD